MDLLLWRYSTVLFLYGGGTASDFCNYLRPAHISVGNLPLPQWSPSRKRLHQPAYASINALITTALHPVCHLVDNYDYTQKPFDSGFSYSCTYSLLITRPNWLRAILYFINQFDEINSSRYDLSLVTISSYLLFMGTVMPLVMDLYFRFKNDFYVV